MTAADEEYVLRWNNYAKSFPIGFIESLHNREFVDVTLVADGHMVKAHRLVLASISPYFREIFNQMSASQQTCVILKDISHETLADLIAYIYRGEVNIKRENLEEFLKTAKSLKIKGLDEDVNLTTMNFGRNFSSNAQHCQTKRKIEQSKSSIPSKRMNTTPSSSNDHAPKECPQADGFKCTIIETEKKSSVHGKIPNYRLNSPTIVDKPNEEYAEQENSKNFPGNGDLIADGSSYNIVADIRISEMGRENLIYNGYRYHKNGLGRAKQPWRCSNYNSKDCRASLSSMIVDGVTMMKIVNSAHTHEPNDT